MPLELISTYTVVTCCHQGCGIHFAVPDCWVVKRREDHSWWYCPNGHSQHWAGPSEAEHLRQRLTYAQDSLARAEARTRRKEYERRAAVGKVTRISKRIAAGVCPCCNRTFANLAAHMSTQHPDFAPAP